MATKKKKVEEELKRLSIALIHSFNEKDFTYTKTPSRRELLSRVSPTFKARVERHPEELSWDGLQSLWRDHASLLEPFEIEKVTADVFTSGRAAVYMECSANAEGGVRYFTMMEMEWRLVDEVWMYMAFSTMVASGLV